jgi:hypothetical protein
LRQKPNFNSAHATSFTRTGKLDMVNRKPYRTAAQQREAKRTAEKRADGAWRSAAPVSFHTRAKQVA